MGDAGNGWRFSDGGDEGPARKKGAKNKLTNGNKPTEGWLLSDDGAWVPSVNDRRRLSMAELKYIAERDDEHAVPGSVVFEVLRRHSTDDEDHQAMLLAFARWNRR